MKRNASRLLSTLLVLCMVLALLPGMALAAETTIYEDESFRFTNVIDYTEADEFGFKEFTCIAPVEITAKAYERGTTELIIYYETFGGERMDVTGLTATLTEPGTYLVEIDIRPGPDDYDMAELAVTRHTLIVKEAEDDGPDTPDTPTPTIPATGTAYPSTQTVDIDGTKIEFQMYALRNADGGETTTSKSVIWLLP